MKAEILAVGTELLLGDILNIKCTVSGAGAGKSGDRGILSDGCWG